MSLTFFSYSGNIFLGAYNPDPDILGGRIQNRTKIVLIRQDHASIEACEKLKPP
jgi:hypothetical protein